jgi:hypothetical protein
MNKKILIDRVEYLAKDFSLSKYNFLKISYLKRLIDETNNFSSHCDTCASNKAVLESMVEEIPLLDDIEYRQPYEKQFNNIRSHFHRQHGFIAPHHFSARYSILGAMMVVVLLAVVSWFAIKKINFDLLLAGGALGLIIGYLWGAKLEQNFRREKKMI